jgi:DNA-binding transcriptional MerR regulator
MILSKGGANPMNQMLTVSTVSKKLGISSRMLRYYEQVGLIESQRMDDYAYRVYDEDAIRKLRQIIILRKLRVPVKQIREIFENSEAAVVIDVFERNISELNEEITAMSTVKAILSGLVEELREKANVRLQLDYLGDSSVFAIVESISLPKNILQEEKSMSDLNKASEQLSKLTDSDVRIIYIPPSAVASAIGTGFDGAAEHEADTIMGKFNDEVLSKINPGTRYFGFNNGVYGNEGIYVRPLEHRYEVWAAVPDDLDIPEPLVKKHFKGGLYAAYTSKPVDFKHWGYLGNWLADNEEFCYDADRSYRDDTPERYIPRWSGWGCLEEHFNSYNIYGLKDRKHVITHIDFLIPIKEKQS